GRWRAADGAATMLKDGRRPLTALALGAASKAPPKRIPAQIRYSTFPLIAQWSPYVLSGIQFCQSDIRYGCSWVIWVWLFLEHQRPIPNTGHQCLQQRKLGIVLGTPKHVHGCGQFQSRPGHVKRAGDPIVIGQ